ncbi:hypothetical protein EDD16DRAFT_1517013 [Pisolithus croceorrhizus]|nr:hypothetical protein EV401DRAFT_1891504 [Pisolithus croceorrhizus]KAI6125883.1 hypothetical protein EDD16DRAFT_1517013 [Pisolithus croceorrhizus]KAI6137522.1 hypothetical protein EDD17DRAFT_1517245 [Pisolithus thermaeus]
MFLLLQVILPCILYAPDVACIMFCQVSLSTVSRCPCSVAAVTLDLHPIIDGKKGCSRTLTGGSGAHDGDDRIGEASLEGLGLGDWGMWTKPKLVLWSAAQETSDCTGQLYSALWDVFVVSHEAYLQRWPNFEGQMLKFCQGENQLM